MNRPSVITLYGKPSVITSYGKRKDSDISEKFKFLRTKSKNSKNSGSNSFGTNLK